MSSPLLPRPASSHPASSRLWAGRLRARWRLVAGLLVAVGIGAAGMHLVDLRRPRIALLPATPSPVVAAVKAQGFVAVKGRVADIFGGRFVVADESGRALVETGPSGESGTLVVPDEIVTVQGRFDRGALHAAAVTHADGHIDLVGPPSPPGPPRPHWLQAMF